MGKPILYGMDVNPNCRSILLVAKAIDLDIDFRIVNLFAGDHMKPEFLKMNPQHTIPTLDDNGQYLWETNAIIPYLILKYSKNDDLYPRDDIYKRARIEQRLHFSNGVIYARLREAVMPIYFNNASGFTQQMIDDTNKAYEFLETFLEKDLYLVGNSLTAADFSCIGNLSALVELIPADVDKYPKLHAWLNRIRALPYYEEISGKGNTKYVSSLREMMEKAKQSK